MNGITGKSGREYSPLPIDNAAGLPQSFTVLFDGRTYRFSLYVDIGAFLLEQQTGILDLPISERDPSGLAGRNFEEGFLVVQGEVEGADGTRETIFLRKVVPDLEYEAENIALIFPQQRVARKNLNGQGNLGSQVTGGIARRWA